MEVQQKSCTRRGMLSVSSSVHDPLGFLAPVVLPAKIMLQETLDGMRPYPRTSCISGQGGWRTWICCRSSRLKGALNLRVLDIPYKLGFRWIEGPKFLCKPEGDWSANVIETAIEADDLEFKKEDRPGGRALSTDYLLEAELAIIRYCQQQRFGEEIATLSSGKATVSRQSIIYRLNPYLDNGLLRVGGRLTKGSLPEETKHPLILSKDQHVATLILNHIYQWLGHSGHNHTRH